MANTLAFTKDKNQIATPWHIVELLSDFFGAQDKSVLDPTAGHGAMLEHAGTRCGIELDEKPFRMLKDRYPDGDFINASVFDCSDWIKAKDPDIVLMNPPFNAEKTKGLAFVSFVAGTLDHGRLAAIVPVGCVSHSNKAINATKAELLKHGKLEAVIALNKELFYPAAAAAVVVLIMTLGAPHSGATWFADFENDGLVKDRTRGRIDKEGTWPAVKERFLRLLTEKPTQVKKKEAPDGPDGYVPCQLKAVTADDDWSPGSVIEIDPAMLRPTDEDFRKTVKDYIDWQIKQYGLEGFLKKNPALLPPPKQRAKALRERIAQLSMELAGVEQEIADTEAQHTGG